jgi:peptidoglycan/xylan/chitin deacetylase (PgdA/CDA1 family)
MAMLPGKELLDNLLLNGYYAATWPRRRRANRERCAQGKAPILVLFYHRIADDRATPWTHSYRLFARQMRWLKKHCELISLEEAQRRIRRGVNDRIAVSITFDDGYADNCDRALPLLIAEKISCTYFVSLRNVLKGKPFSHDLRRGATCRPNTIPELCWMAEQGIEIGAHTRTHADLGRVIDECKLYDEVVVAGEELQAAVGHPVRYFSFPFGLPQNLNLRAFQMAYEYGYEGVCSAYGDYNFPGDDPFHLRRIHVENMGRLRNWGTIDPRKINPSYTMENYLPSPNQSAESTSNSRD